MFLNRQEAGKRLASKLDKVKRGVDAVIAIPRGGVVVGKVISLLLGIPLYALVVRKIGAPPNPELAIGAVGPNDTVYWEEDIIKTLNIDKRQIDKLLETTREVLAEREKRLGIKMPHVFGKNVILVDDGVATGATVVAATLALKNLGVDKIILAVPVISKRTKRQLSPNFTKIVSILTPKDFQAVGQFYQEFPQVEDEEVKEILNSKY